MEVLQEYDVVAIDGEGIYVTDGDSCWQIGGHVDDPSDKLQRDYKQSIE